jgi:hypothetical protein
MTSRRHHGDAARALALSTAIANEDGAGALAHAVDATIT